MNIEDENEQLKKKNYDDSIKEALEFADPEKDMLSYIKAVGNLFVQKKIAMFPRLCKEFRYVNQQLQQNLRHYGKKGKFTNSYGWNDAMDKKVSYSIPRDLHVLMVNMFDKGFWNEENAKTHDKFLKKILDGENPLDIWEWCKRQYQYDPLNLAGTRKVS